jgi:hypothetical protein
MQVNDWITLGAAFIVAVGWFVTGYLNQRKDVSLKRLEYRLKALEASVPIFMAFQKKEDPFSSPDFVKQFEDAHAKILLYGLDDEIRLMNKFVKELMEKSPSFVETYSAFANLVRSRIRRELEIKM